MPQIGLIGFERSGKTSLFNAVTGSEHEAGYATHDDPHIGVVKVPDSRLEQLSRIYKPKKTTFADLQYIDFPGSGFGRESGPHTRFLKQLSQMDAFIHVVRAFENEAVPSSNGNIDPARDIDSMLMELLFADAALVEKRLTRIAIETKAAKPADRAMAERDATLLKHIQSGFADGVPLRGMDLSDDDRGMLRQYQFLSDRPIVTVLNIHEQDVATTQTLTERYQLSGASDQSMTVALSASLEMELQGLSETDGEEYRQSVGVGESALNAVIRLSYAGLGLISFFTVGSDECRAWTVKDGDNAQRAARCIHTDLERGFIRAEVVLCEDLVATGSEAEARKQALLHTEGKDYLVQDGDVLHILFSV